MLIVFLVVYENLIVNYLDDIFIYLDLSNIESNIENDIRFLVEIFIVFGYISFFYVLELV